MCDRERPSRSIPTNLSCRNAHASLRIASDDARWPCVPSEAQNQNTVPNPSLTSLITRKRIHGSEYPGEIDLTNQHAPSIILPPDLQHLRSHAVGPYKRQAYLELIQAWCGPLTDKTILKTDLYEEAYGSDMFLFDFMAADNRVYAVDLSPTTTRYAQRRAQTYKVDASRFITADVRALPYPDNLFDLIISSSTLDHFPEADLRISLRELHRVLQPEGILLLAVHNQHNINWQLGRLLRLLPHNTELYTLPQITKVSKDCGFNVQKDCALLHIPSRLTTTLVILRLLLGVKRATALAHRGIAAFMRTTDPNGYATASYIALRLTKDLHMKDFPE
jgi:SAM-dependent methyltransferase